MSLAQIFKRKVIEETIMITKDYSIFRNIQGNRDVNENHIEKLAKAIKRKNLLEFYPVLVNEKMEVIDGQHRLNAAAISDVPIHYAVVPGLQLEDVMSINTHSKSWSQVDFVQAYIRLGNEDYITLKNFKEQYNLPYTASAMLLSGLTGNGGNQENVNTHIKAGSFKVVHLDRAHKIAKQIVALDSYTDFETRKDRVLMLALTRLEKNPVFDFERFLSRLKTSSHLKIDRRVHVREYLLQFDDIYNYKTSLNRVDIYASSLKNGR